MRGKMGNEITIGELIAKLNELDPKWMIAGTRSASLWICQPDYSGKPGQQYGYVFPDNRPTRILTGRTK